MGTGVSSTNNPKSSVTPRKRIIKSTVRGRDGNRMYSNIMNGVNFVQMDPRPKKAAFLCGDVNGWNHVVWKGGHETNRRISISDGIDNYDGVTSFVNQIVGFGHSCELSNCKRDFKNGGYQCKLRGSLGQSKNSNISAVSDIGSSYRQSHDRKSCSKPYTFRTYTKQSWRRQCLDTGSVAARINSRVLSTAREVNAAKYRQTEIYL